MTEIVLNAIIIIGVIAYSVSASLIAIDHRVDMFGVMVLAAITSFGGGMTRDLLLGNLPPLLFRDPFYYILAGISVATALVVFWIARFLQEKFVAREKLIDQITNVFDAVALGVFATTGAKTVMDFADHAFFTNGFLVITLGTLTAVGGGMIRDVMIREVPFVLRKRVYAVAAILGASAYYLLVRLGAFETAALIVGCVLCSALRICATAFKWNFPRALP